MSQESIICLFGTSQGGFIGKSFAISGAGFADRLLLQDMDYVLCLRIVYCCLCISKSSSN